MALAPSLTYYATRNAIAGMAIQPFNCKHTQALFEGAHPRKFRAFEDAATRKLTQLDAALTLDFLRSPPGNMLEALKGDRKGQYSIRINGQFRVCFVWTKAGPAHVEIVDYH
jgi:proteic killer suppression protein